MRTDLTDTFNLDRVQLITVICYISELQPLSLLSHCSNRSHAGTTQHRRILHYEFAGVPELPEGFEWHQFLR